MNALRRSIYLDHNATTAVSARAFAALEECLRLGPVNPSSKHAMGERAALRVMQARAEVAALLGAAPAELVFTSGGTESNHLAILAALALQSGRRHIIASEVEHPSTLMLLRHLQTRGVHVSLLPVDGEGRVGLEALADTLTPDTALVSLMWANNETGVLFPIAAAAQLARERGVLFHTDAVQAVGKVAIDVGAVPVDFLSLSGHKLHAPGGIGALFVRKGIKLPPLQFGHQERGRRGGTENVGGIVALGAACLEIREQLPQRLGRLRALRDRLEARALQLFPEVSINGGGADRIANTSNLRFGNLDADAMLTRLDHAGICAASGAACASAQNHPSHVLTAMGLPAEAALASLRFSFGRDNSEQEVDTLIDVLQEILADLAPGRAGPAFLAATSSRSP